MAKTPQDKVERLTSLVKNIPGDMAEIGVWKGRTFAMMVPIAKRQNKEAHAFDSFCGMDEPTEMDRGQYPKGQFDIGGVEAFNKLLLQYNILPSEYKTCPGYIPECFTLVPEDQTYSYIFLDVDQYEVTKISLEWLWDRLNSGGVLLMDDVFTNPKKTGLATGAVREWMKEKATEFEELEYADFQMAVRKL